MTDATHLPAFRMAIACIVRDPAMPEPLRARMLEHLKELGLTRTLESPEHDALLTEMVVWADTQGTSASAMIRKALGQTPTDDAGTAGPQQGHRARTQAAFDAAYTQGVTMETVVDPTTARASEELYGEPDWSELDRQAALLLRPPWDYPKDRVAKAVAAIKAGHVTLGSPASSLAYVTSEDSQRKYTVRENGCTCRATHPCYHMAAAELVRLIEGKKAQTSLFPVPPTIDERLAAPAVALEEPEAMATAVLDIPTSPVTLPEEELILPITPPRPAPALTLPCRSISAIIADLSRPLPASCFSELLKSGAKIRFLPWYHRVRLLDTYAPGWSGEVRKLDIIPDPKGVTGDKLAITYRVTIPAAEGLVYREATGQEDVEMVEEYTDKKSGEVRTRQAFGDSTSNAEAMAFSRAAAKFGVGLELYDKAEDGHDALVAHLKQEREREFEALKTLVDTLGLDRTQVITWLQKQTGAARNDQIPLWALRALISHLSSQPATAA